MTFLLSRKKKKSKRLIKNCCHWPLKPNDFNKDGDRWMTQSEQYTCIDRQRCYKYLKRGGSGITVWHRSGRQRAHGCKRGRGDQEAALRASPFDKNAPSHAAGSHIHTLSLMHRNEFMPLNLTAAHILCLHCTARLRIHTFVNTQ